MSQAITLRQGVVDIEPIPDGNVRLETIYRILPGVTTFCECARWRHPSGPILVLLGDDDGLLKESNVSPHGLPICTYVRPWDGSPLVGPLAILLHAGEEYRGFEAGSGIVADIVSSFETVGFRQRGAFKAYREQGGD